MQTPPVHPPRERLHGLDAVRGIALLFGVIVHASIVDAHAKLTRAAH